MAVDTVHVWLVDTGLPDATIATLAKLLDGQEQQRARTLARPEHRRRFVAVHGAARQILGRHLATAPQLLRWERGPHGKPELAGRQVRVNLSHSGRLGAMAITDQRAVGVDLEQIRELDACGLAARFFPPAEAAFVAAAADPATQLARFTRLWTRKEAWVKCTGGRLAHGLTVPVRGNGELVCGGAGPPQPCLVRDLPVPHGFRAAVALAGPEPFRISRSWWDMREM